MKTMKPTIFKISTLILLFAMFGEGCKKDPTVSHLSSDVKTFVFEAKYGIPTEIDFAGEKLRILVKDIKDNVTIDCSLVDFQNNSGPGNIRIYSYLQINDQKNLLTVESIPCGAFQYRNNGNDSLDIINMVNDLKTAPANEKFSSWFNDTFVKSFGEGNTIENTNLRIYMAKAFPVYFGHQIGKKEDYKFLFILTKQ
jgi:hypothetical protein